MIAFRKLYVRSEEGQIPGAIVAFQSKPYSWGDNYDEIVKRLFIDLWIVMLQFEWIKKVEKGKI